MAGDTNSKVRLYNKSGWQEVLAEESLSTATRTSEDFPAHEGRSMLLWVKTANEAGTASFTPSLQIKDPAGTALTVWTAASAITANGSFLYVLSPDALTGMNGASVTETALVGVPMFHNIVLTYSGTPANDKIDTQAWALYF